MNAPTLVAAALATVATAAFVATQEVAAVATAGRSTADIIQIIGVVSGAVIAVATVTGGLIVQIVTARMKVALANTVVPVTAAVAEVKETAKVIEGHVNSAATKAAERAEAGLAREAALQATIERLEATAIALAQATAAQHQAPPAPPTGAGL